MRCARLLPALAVLARSGVVVLALTVPAAAWAAGAGESVLVTRVDGPITPVIADHLADALARAERGADQALLVELDTPGGLDSSMRDIVQDFLAARVPVVVYVSPAGARAASAGALIAWSAHVVAMAPGTTIGAATPVDLEGGEVGGKIVEDAAAYARAVARERGRNVEVAAAAVTEGRALSDTEAVEQDAADLIAPDREALLAALDGRQIPLPGGTTVTLRTAGVAVEEYQLSFFRRLLQALANPTLAFLFMSLGTLGIIYELATPGMGAAGGAGVVFILLSLFSLAVLPIDAVGLLFLLAAAALFAAELFAPGIGVAAAFGSLSLVLAGVFLFREDAPGLSLNLALVLPTAVAVGGAVMVAGRLAVKTRDIPSTTGAGALIGRDAVVARAVGRSGQAMVDGSWWNVRADGPLRAGERVRVRDVEGLDLIVEPVGGTEEPASGRTDGPRKEHQ